MTSLLAQPARKTGLSLTPLIDVVFILLLFFMLTSSFSHEHELSLSAPVATSVAQSIEPTRLLLTVDGRFMNVATNTVLDAQQLNNMATRQASVLIHPVPMATVQTIVIGLEHLMAMGINKVSLGDVYPESVAP